MGLDNGIRIKNIQKHEIPRRVILRSEMEWTPGELELCYWRKCWNIRQGILSLLDVGLNSDQYEFTLNRTQVLNIKDFLIDLLKNPKDWSNSIWTYEEMKPVLEQDIKNLKWLARRMKWHPAPETIVYFYDSY